MRTIVVKDEQNLAALSDRVRHGDAPGAGVSPDAEAAMRAANPHLDLDRLRPGAVVVVPDHPDLAQAPARRVRPPVPGASRDADPGDAGVDAEGGAGDVADAGATLSTAGHAVRQAAARSESHHAELRKALTAPRLTRAAAGNPRVRDELTRMTQALDQAQRRAAQWHQHMSALLDQARQQWDRGTSGPS